MMSMQSVLSDTTQPHHLPSVTVVVPTLNEEAFIVETLAQLSAQDYPLDLMEVLVVDGGSTDRTTDKVRDFIVSSPVRMRLLRNPNRLSSAARNIGIRHARGEYVLFVDAHVFIPNRQVVLQMALAAHQHQALVLGRPQPLNPPGLNWVQHSISAVRASPLGHSGESYIYSQFEGWVSPLSVAVMYHCSLFAEHGLFDESFDAAEDVEFNYRLERAGIKAFISPLFTIRYYPRKNLPALFKQMRRYGEGRINFTRKHPERFRLETFVPWLTSTTVVTYPSLLVSFDGLRLPLILLALAMTLLVMALTARHLVRRHLLPVLIAPLCLCVIHFGLAYGILRGLFASAPTVAHPQLELRQEG